MKILIDTGHPVHIHFYAAIAKQLQKKGHEISFSIREKDCSLQLIRSYYFPFRTKGRGSYSLLLKPFYLFSAVASLLRQSWQFRPDIFLSFASPYASFAAFLLGKPHIVFDDTEGDPVVQQIYKALATRIITPSSFMQELGSKQKRINAFKEQAYLKDYRAKPEGYILIRLVNHGAMHDLFSKVWQKEKRFAFFRQLASNYRLIISSEINLPNDLNKYRFDKPAEMLHETMANATMIVGESATVAAEAAVLGIPSVYIDYNTRGYIEILQDKYQLVKRFSPEKSELEETVNYIDNIMSRDSLQEFQFARDRLFNDTEDIIQFIIGEAESFGLQ